MFILPPNRPGHVLILCPRCNVPPWRCGHPFPSAKREGDAPKGEQ